MGKKRNMKSKNSFLDLLKDKLKIQDDVPNKKKIPKRTHFSLWYFIIAFAIMILLQNLIPKDRVDNIPYSQFKKLVAESKVDNVVITDQRISGEYKEAALAEKKEVPGRSSAARAKHFMAVRVEDPDLVKDLDKSKINYSGQVESKWLGNFFSWFLPLVVLVAVWGFLFRRIGAGSGVMSFGKSRAQIYVEDETSISFEDVAGIDEAKEELVEIVEFLRNPKKYQSLGGKIPKGVLLVGLPGTGKTLLAKAVAGEAKVPFLNTTGSDFVEMFVGVGAARVRDLFAQAEQKAPCIVFIDELDALGKTRGISPLTGGHDEREQTLNQLLVEMDGFNSKKGVIIMAATNRPEILDPALMRPGRFDRQVLIDRPDLNGRIDILKIHAKNIKLSKNVDLKVIAGRTSGFVGADLANIVNEAALLAARKDRKEVEMQDFDEAIDRIVAGLEKKKRVMNPREKEIVAYHESGHALVASSVANADPVHKVSIVPRGLMALGYTQQVPTEDRYLLTRAELMDRIAVLLGGRAAEEIKFGDVSTGAQNDLQRATDIARSMVRQYGMSEKLGPVSFERPSNPLFPNGGFGQVREYSEEVALEIDREVHSMIEDTYKKVKNMLLEMTEALETLASRLLEKEVVEGAELKEIIQISKIKKTAAVLSTSVEQKDVTQIRRKGRLAPE